MALTKVKNSNLDDADLVALAGNDGSALTGVSVAPSSITGLTSTAAELNILDGVTSTAAELNILDGVTSTAAELNILDGVTSTAAELNILDGVTSTSAELNILDGVTSTAAELNILDGVTSTSAELNILDGVTSTTDELNYVDGVTSAIQTQLDGKQASDADLTTLATNGIGTSANQLVQLDGSAKLPAVDGSALTSLPASSEWITVWNHADDGNTTYVDFTTSESYTTLKGIELKLINVRATSSGKLYLLPLNSSGSEIGTGSTAQAYSTSGSQVLLTTGGVKLAEYGVNNSSLGVSGEIKIYWDYYSYNNRQWHGSCFLGYRSSTATADTKFEREVFMPNTYNGNTLTANLGGLRLNFTNDTVDYTFQDGCVLARLITK